MNMLCTTEEELNTLHVLPNISGTHTLLRKLYAAAVDHPARVCRVGTSWFAQYILVVARVDCVPLHGLPISLFLSFYKV